MYLWVIIATFVAALAALGTSLRSDIRSVTINSQAQNIATKLYIQHHGMMGYAHARIGSGPEGKIGFWPQVWNPKEKDEYKSYLPYGFNPDGGTVQFRSEIFCFDSQGKGLPVGCQAAGGGADPAKNCCAQTGVSIYMVTYGKLPQKWLDINSGRPSGDMLRAMRNATGFVNGMGYVINSNEYSGNTGKTSMGIISQGQTPYMPLPEGIINDKNFSDTCKDNYCLIYMSSM